MDYILYFILTISILVFIHELGHFLAAKLSKMRTEVFAIGFGKRLFGWNKPNGFSLGDLPKELDLEGCTDYRISLLPLGGYVKISGMVDESFDTKFASEEPKPYEFRARPTLQKLFVITAGVMMNLTLTLLIFAGINFFQGKQVLKTTTIGYVNENTFASQAGFQTNDKVISVNDKRIDDWEELYNELLLTKLGIDKKVVVERNNEKVELTINGSLLSEASHQSSSFLPLGNSRPMITEILKDSPASKSDIKPNDIFLELNNNKLSTSTQAIEIISTNKNKELTIVILRNNDTVRTSIIPSVEGKIGVKIGDAYTGKIDFKKFGLIESFVLGTKDIFQYTVLTFSSIKGVFKGDIEFSNAFGGPVKIAQFAAKSADLGIVSFLRFIALLSLTLAILNIMPFPVLDGGHFVIILIEGLIKKELPIKFKIAIQNAGFVLLLILMAFILYNDILSL